MFIGKQAVRVLRVLSFIIFAAFCIYAGNGDSHGWASTYYDTTGTLSSPPVAAVSPPLEQTQSPEPVSAEPAAGYDPPMQSYTAPPEGSTPPNPGYFEQALSSPDEESEETAPASAPAADINVFLGADEDDENITTVIWGPKPPDTTTDPAGCTNTETSNRCVVYTGTTRHITGWYDTSTPGNNIFPDEKAHTTYEQNDTWDYELNKWVMVSKTGHRTRTETVNTPDPNAGVGVTFHSTKVIELDVTWPPQFGAEGDGNERKISAQLTFSRVLETGVAVGGGSHTIDYSNGLPEGIITTGFEWFTQIGANGVLMNSYHRTCFMGQWTHFDDTNGDGIDDVMTITAPNGEIIYQGPPNPAPTAPALA